MIAHVGAFKPFGICDRMRISKALVYLCKLKLEPKKQNLDIINLCYGRDFLAESIKYEMVFLHTLFHSVGYDTRSSGWANKNEVMHVSPLHTVEAFKKRLIETEAKTIVVCDEQPFSLGSYALGSFEDYGLIVCDVGNLSIYQKGANPGIRNKAFEGDVLQLCRDYKDEF